MKMLPKTLLIFLSFCILGQILVPVTESNKTLDKAFKFLGISWKKEGQSLNREIQIPMVEATPTDDSTTPPPITHSSDVKLSPYNDAYLRLYIPRNPPKNKKLPLIIYLHGGDFVLFSASTVIFHNFCNNIASLFPAVVVSVEYRLAPENPLPAAYEDALNAVLWAKDQALEIGGRDPWMEYADFSRVFLLGSSAGANIVYHTAINSMDYDLSPLKIKGLLLNQAFFSGFPRTESEIRLKNDSHLPLYVNDILWELAIPGPQFSRYSGYCDPLAGGTYGGRVNRLPRVYIKGDYGDPLVDRSVMLADFLVSCKVSVTKRFKQGGFHGIELQNATAAQELYTDMKNFVNSISESDGVDYSSS